MKKIEINGISGLFYELYSPVKFDKLNTKDSDTFFQNWNDLFWKDVLSEKFYNLLIRKMSCSDSSKLSVWEKAVLANTTVFANKVLNAAKAIAEYALSPQEMFNTLETLTIYCKLLNKYVLFPFTLSLQEGIQSGNDDSFSFLWKSVNESSFCRDYLISMMELYLEKVDFIWINGTLNFANLLAIKWLREINPDAFVGIRYHESEYFSYNKIEDCLSTNEQLFSVIDCIVLDNCEDTIRIVEQNFRDFRKLREICNLLIKNRDTGTIEHTPTKKRIYYVDNYVKMPYIKDKEIRIKTSPVINMRLFANKICYWHKCAFCGINKKYKFHNMDASNNETLDHAIEIVEKYNEIGYSYFWFEDEAVKKQDLLFLSRRLIEKGIKIFWQVRTRFDAQYSKDDCKLLFEAGLREIRFGYESGDCEVLKSMRKYPDDFDYDIIGENIKQFSSSGIHVHLPVILGFPTETETQRNITISELKILKAMCDISFNLNRFLLDVSADAYKSFYKFNIFELHLPTTCDDFIGNFAQFNMNRENQLLDAQRGNVMRDELYPWMPHTSLLTSVIFYRLSEASRMTLLWATEKPAVLSNRKGKILNSNISIVPRKDSIILYNWDNHCIFSVEPDAFKKLEALDFSSFSDKFLEELYEKRILI